MNKGVIIKVSIIVGFFAIVFGLAYGCSTIKDNDVTPQISNGSDTYATVGDIVITNQELWEMMKISDGLAYLNQYIEEHLLATYISEVTQGEIDKAIEKAIYGTNDADVLAEIKSDATQDADLVLAFERSLVLQGFDPENDDDLRSYVELQIAKENYTRDYILGVDAEDTLAISDEDVQAKYLADTKGDVCAVVVRFSSYNEVAAVMDEFNLVPDYNDGLGKYFGTDPIGDVATGDFDETNTTQLTDQQVLSEYIKLYNYMNPNETPMDDTTLLEDFCTTYGATSTYVNEDFTNDYLSTTDQKTFATYLWSTLSVDEEDENAVRYSATPKAVGNFQVFAFKVSEAEITPFADLTTAEVDAIREELLDSKLATSNIQVAMDVLWAENEFEIFDPMFKLQYEFNQQVTFDNNGSSSVVAKLGTMEITADQLFDYMQDKLGTYYTIEMVKTESLLQSEFYTDVYGDSYDYLNSNNETMVEHRAELRDMKSIFSSDGYASYGFSSRNYTWDEFLIIAFGSATESDVIRDLFVIGNLQPYLVRDLISYQNAAEFIQAQVDEYFSLNVKHALLYLDKDFDFAPDDFNDYVDGLSGADLTEYNSLLVDFEDLIKEKINNDDYTLANIIKEYNEGLIDDSENEWAPFKAYGFYILTEDLSASASLSNKTADNYDEDFVAALKRIYDSFVDDVALDSTMTTYNDDRMVQSNFGLHYIIATKGADFVQPTAVYDNADGDYLDEFIGTTVAPNQSQVDLYIEIRFAQDVNKNVDFTAPTSVYDAVDSYFGEIYDAYFTSSGYTIATSSYILDNAPVFANSQADRVQFLENVVGILYEVAFPEEFLTPAELLAD